MSKLLSLALLLLMPVFAFSQELPFDQMNVPETPIGKFEVLGPTGGLEFEKVTVEKQMSQIYVRFYIKNTNNRTLRARKFIIHYKDLFGDVVQIDDEGTLSLTISNSRTDLAPGETSRARVTYRASENGYERIFSHLLYTPAKDLHLVISEVKTVYE